jgi:hypothetical protein
LKAFHLDDINVSILNNAFIIACNETNLIHCLSSVYSVTTSLHVSGLLVAHHQEVTMYICNKLCVLYLLVDCPRSTGPNNSQPKITTHTNCHIYRVFHDFMSLLQEAIS